MRTVRGKFQRKVAVSCLNLIVGLGMVGCTSNPFTDNNVQRQNSTISGKVELRDGGSSEGVYVWLGGFNIGTRVNESGEFQLTLPPKDSQGLAGGISGVFDLYFFLANYKLASAQVVTQNGEFLYSRGEINKDGRLSPAKVLTRMLRISTKVTPASFRQNYAGTINVEVSLEAIDKAMTIVFPNTIPGRLGAIFIRNVATKEVFVFAAYPGNTLADEVTIGSFEHKRSLIFSLLTFRLPAARYEVIPYLLVIREDVPVELLDSLGSGITALNPNYLKMPIKRLGGEFEVTP